MKHLVDSLQDVLLVFTILMLVYVLYRRLLLVMGKNKLNRQYAMPAEKLEWPSDRQAILGIQLPDAMPVSWSVFGEDHSLKITGPQEEFAAGEHQLKVDCQSLQPGKYYLKVNTKHQESSIYFDLK